MGAITAFHSVDYTGAPVIAAYRQIEPVGWGLVVKQSQAEAFAPIYELARRIAVLTTLVLLGTALLAILLARTLTRPLGEGTTISFSLPVYRIVEPIVLRVEELSSVSTHYG